MHLDTAKIIVRIDELLVVGRTVIATKRYADFMGDHVDHGKQAGFRALCLSFLKNLYGEKHPFYINFDEQVNGSKLYHTESAIQILEAVKNEIAAGWLFSIREIISAELFSNFLEMAKHLLDEKYKDAAAVMIGSVLEGHLIFLAEKNNIGTIITKGEERIPKKADVLNADLAKTGVYNILQQKNITAWLDLRNKAAHAKYNEYDLKQVELLYLGVLNFTTKYL